ncbi:hypothetical protein N0V90_006332 [Kalmusia sp. IMI 367209]|nr:hypothetical protein N0V90_006332 [Kalmusia sp. IMI 367209]
MSQKVADESRPFPKPGGHVSEVEQSIVTKIDWQCMQIQNCLQKVSSSASITSHHERGSNTTSSSSALEVLCSGATEFVNPTRHVKSPESSLPQIDGPQDYRLHKIPPTMLQTVAPGRRPTADAQHQILKTAVRDLLPYCTIEIKLTEEQVIRLSDIAGSLKEVMLIALQAKMDERAARHLAEAVGVDDMRGIVDFFDEEFEI